MSIRAWIEAGMIALGTMVALGCDDDVTGPLSARSSNETLATAITYSNNRIAVNVDGNQHDKDDWAATPMILALLAKRGVQSKLVHYDYNNHLGNNSSTMASQMETSALRGAELFGFDRSRFFNDQTNLTAAITNLKNQINASSATDPLFIIAAGPMEVLWRAVKASEVSKRQYVTIISHSPWNDKHADTPQMIHTAQDVKALGINWVQIIDQNPRLYTRDWTPWQWLKNASDSRLRWVHARMQATGKPDVSDAGMCYFLLKNDQYGTPGKLWSFFGSWI